MADHTPPTQPDVLMVGIEQRIPRERGWLHHLWRSLSRNRLTLLGLLILLMMGFTAAMAPLLTPYGFEVMDLTSRLQPPSTLHPFGTDRFGRDILSRVLYGGRVSLLVSMAAMGGALVIGTILGGIAAFYGGWVDEVIMRLMDLIMAFPYIVLAITLIVILKPGVFPLITVIAITRIPRFARIMRGATLSIKNQEYIVAANAIGQRDVLILARHILPNCITPLAVMASLSAGTAIRTEASLSFLGLGVQPPISSWGTMISDGMRTVTTAPWTTTFPGLVLSITVLGLNLVGDGLRDALDPRLRRL
jgi:peptide/nickel transport system permease protein